MTTITEDTIRKRVFSEGCIDAALSALAAVGVVYLYKATPEQLVRIHAILWPEDTDPSAMRDTAAMQARKVIPPAAPAQIKRALHWSERSPDLSASSHLIAPHFGSAEL